MGYDGKINRKLRTVELNDDDECLYKLAYDEEQRRYFKRKDILHYVNEHYLEKDNIIEENLLNDLNTFKTYRDDVEITEKNWDVFQGFITIYVALINDVFKSERAYIARLFYILFILAISMVVYFVRTWKHSNYYKLKYINNAIYTLETIKEDMDKNENSREKYNATKNKYSPRTMYERKRR